MSDSIVSERLCTAMSQMRFRRAEAKSLGRLRFACELLQTKTKKEGNRGWARGMKGKRLRKLRGESHA